MPSAKIVWNADTEKGASPQRRGLSCQEIVRELARLDPNLETGQPTDTALLGWLIRCAKVVDWNTEPEYGSIDMRAALDATIYYVKWAAVISACVGIVIGIVIGRFAI